MFGYHDAREDKSIASVGVSAAFFGTAFYVMHKHLVHSNYNVRKAFGMFLTSGAAHQKAKTAPLTDAPEGALDFLRDDSPERFAKEFNRHNSGPVNQTLIDDVEKKIVRAKKTLSAAAQSYESRVSYFRSRAETIYKQASHKGVTIGNGTGLHHISAESQISSAATRMIGVIDKCKKIAYQDVAAERVRQKYPWFRPDMEITYNNLDAMELYEKHLFAISSQVEHVTRDLDSLSKDFYFIDEEKMIQTIEKVQTKVKDLYEFSHHRDRVPRPWAVNGHTVDVKIMDRAATVDEFFNRAFGEHTSKKIRQGLAESGISKAHQKLLIDKSNTLRITPEHFSHRVGSVFKVIEKYTGDESKGFMVTDINTYYRHEYQSKRVLFRVKTRVKNPVGEWVDGQFEFSLRIPEHTRIGKGIPYLNDDVIGNQLRVIREHLPRIIKDSVKVGDPTAIYTQKKIDSEQARSLQLVPEPMSELEAIKVATTISGDPYNLLNVQLIGDDRLREAFREYQIGGGSFLKYIKLRTNEKPLHDMFNALEEKIAKVKSESEFLNLLSQHMEGFEYEQILHRVSSNQAVKNKINNLDIAGIHPDAALSPMTSKLTQATQATPNNFPKGPHPYVVKGRPMGENSFPMIFGIDPFVEDGGIRINHKWIGKAYTEDHEMTFTVDNLDLSLAGIEKNAIIPKDAQGVVHLGTQNFEPRTVRAKRDLICVNKEYVGGQYVITVREQVPVAETTKFGVMPGYAGLGVTGRIYGKTEVGFLWSMNTFNRNDIGAAVHMLIGEIQLESQRHPEKIDLIRKKFREKIQRNGRPVHDTEIHYRVNGSFLQIQRNEDVLSDGEVESFANEWIGGLMEIKKEIGMYQSMRDPSEMIRLADSMGVPVKGMDNNLFKKSGKFIKWYKQIVPEMEAAFVGSLTSIFSKRSTTSDLYLSSWLKTGGYSESQISEYMNLIYESPKGGTEEELIERIAYRNKKLTELAHNKEITRMFRYEYVGKNRRDLSIRAQIVGAGTAYTQSSMSQWGSENSTIKISNDNIVILRHNPKAKKLLEWAVTEINDQSFSTYGKWAIEFHIGTGKYKPDGPNLDNVIKDIYKENITSLLHGGKSTKDYRAMMRFLTDTTIDTEQVTYKYQGGYYTEESLHEKFPGLKPDDIQKVERVDLSKRLRHRDAAEFIEVMRRRTGGRGYLDFGGSVPIRIPGMSSQVNYTTLQFMNDDWSINLLDNRSVVMNEKIMAFRNIMIARLAGNKTYREVVYEEANKYVKGGAQKNLKGNWVAHVPGAMATVSFGEEFAYDRFGKPVMEYQPNMVYKNDLIVTKDFLNIHKDAFEAMIDSTSAEDLRFLSGHMRDRKNLYGESNPLHPSMNAKSMEKAVAEYERIHGISIDALLDRMSKSNLGLKDDADLRKLYEGAVRMEILPTKGIGGKHPMGGTPSMWGSAIFWRDTPGISGQSGSSVNAYMSTLFSLKTKIDNDNDQIFLFLNTPGVKDMAIDTMADPDPHKDFILYDGTLHRKSIDSKEAVAMVYDPVSKQPIMVPYSEARKRVGSAVKKDSGISFSTESALEELRRWKGIKTGAPLTYRMSTAFGYMIDEEFKGSDTTVLRQLFDSFMGTKEWSIGQKRAGDFHNTEMLAAALEHIHLPGNLEEVRANVAANKYGSELSKILDYSILDESMLDYIQRSGGQGNTTLDLIHAFQKNNPNSFKYGTESYILNHGVRSYASNLIKSNLKGKQLEYMDSLFQFNSRPFLTPEESFGKSFKRNMKTVFDEQTIKRFQGFGTGAKVAAGAFLLLNLFTPNQSKYLGHMPGKGGEFYDWSFTNPEMEWSPLMHTPLNYNYSEDRVHMQMYNPNLLDAKRRPVELPPMSYARALQGNSVPSTPFEF